MKNNKTKIFWGGLASLFMGAIFLFFLIPITHAESCRVLYADGWYQDAASIQGGTNACQELQYKEITKYPGGHAPDAISPKTGAAERLNCNCPGHGMVTFNNTSPGDSCESLCAKDVAPNADNYAYPNSGLIDDGSKSEGAAGTGSGVVSDDRPKSSGLIPCGNSSNPEDACTFCDFFVMALKLMQWGMGLLFILAGAGFFISGIMYIVSAGNSTMMTSAKDFMKACIIGVVIVLCAWLIVNTTMWILGAHRTGIWFTIDC
jgi:hypothetical protein